MAISNWSEEIQRLIIALALRGDLLSQLPLDPELFGSAALAGSRPPRQRIAAAIQSHWDEYKSVTPEVVGEAVLRETARLGPEERGAVEREWRQVLETRVPADPRAACDEFRRRVELRALERGILQAADVLSRDGAAGMQQAREILARADARPGPGGGLVFRRFDEIPAEAVDWMWPSHLARGSVTLLCGDPGLGKSKVSLDLAARHSRGRPWPDGLPGGRPGVTVILSSEDHAGYTIKPRLVALGADHAKVLLVEAVRDRNGERQLSLDLDLPALERLVGEQGVDLIVIDPISAYLGATDSWKDSDLRRVLGPLAKFAEREGVAVLGLVHLTKSSDRKAIMRLQGSVAFPAFARLVFGVTENPAVSGGRILVCMKTNICAKPLAMLFEHEGMGVKWGESFTMTEAGTEDLFRPQRPAPKLEQAKQLLLDMAPGNAAEILEQARERGIDDTTIYRARKALGFRMVRTGFGPASRVRWELPQGQPEV